MVRTDDSNCLEYRTIRIFLYITLKAPNMLQIMQITVTMDVIQPEKYALYSYSVL